jgi:DNA/RNA endonuclease YhcR with UshA esterase domain
MKCALLFSCRYSSCIYWYEFTPGADHAVTWTRHTIDYGSQAGGGLQMAVRDDGDGAMDVVSAGKSRLFLAENQTRRPAPIAKQR